MIHSRNDLRDHMAALPLAVLEQIVMATFRVIRRNHPRLFERLEGYGAARILVAPTDLPLVFLLHPDPANPRLAVHSRHVDLNPTASVRGPMLRLIDLLEGAVDGDALFFSRELSIEGDTGAILALRNAIEAEEIVLFSELAGALGPLGWPIRLAGERGPDAIAALRAQLNRIVGRPDARGRAAS